MKGPVSTTYEIIEDIRAGRMVIITDDESRENEGDLVIAAEHITPEAINFMSKYGRGLICMPVEGMIADRLRLKPMAKNNTSRFSTAFTVSIEAREGITTGISAFDRAHTVKVATAPNSTADDIATPGHIFPLRAAGGGVLSRIGHTEAAVDLAYLAGLNGAAVICEIMNDDGTMARMDDLAVFAVEHDLKIGTIADLVRYRLETEKEAAE